MPIESDQLVFDYLSKVGDLAQQHQLPSNARMRLVTEVRSQVEQLRAADLSDSPATVRKLLARVGTPEAVVRRAIERGDGVQERPAPTDDGANSAHPYGMPDPDRPLRPAPDRPSASDPTAGTPAPPTPTAGPTRGGTPGGDGPSGGTGVLGGSLPGASFPGASILGSGILGGLLSGQGPFPGRGGPASGTAGEDPGEASRGTPGGTQSDTPEAPSGGTEPDTRRRSRFVPRARGASGAEPEGPSVPVAPASPAASPPHLAGEDELAPSGAQPDWWRIDATPLGGADNVPGFVGGVEIPEILRPPPVESEELRPRVDMAKGDAKEAEDDEEAEEAEEKPRGRRSARLRPRLRGYSNPLLLFAAASLVVGAFLGNWIALGVGWVLAYTSRRLSQNESKFAVLWIPGLAVAGGCVWLWGRVEKGWGAEVAEDGMKAAVQDTWPWVVRGAAVASAVFLVWRSQRHRG